MLRFTKGPSITASVDGGFTVEFRNQTLTPCAAALQVLQEMGYQWKTARGGAYWDYEGETIMDIAERVRS